ncbi:diguanylate cyclase [Lysinibacillus sp. KU-BSD001]|uniref:diguanylate cyclase n=1 Tax=Lysinibacillus sp. KU-BSD001 TaxID=3141328 RepID=UPI0036EAB9FB
MVQSILSNLAIILLGHLFMSMLLSQSNRLSKQVLSICIVLLFSTVIISMFYLPIEIDGYKFDLRLIPLIFLAIFRGWKITLSTLIIVCTWRYFMGGVGALPGILAGMVGPTLFVLFFYALTKRFNNLYEKIFVLTVCWLISDFPIVFIVPNGWEVFKNIFLIRYTSFLAVAFTYYSFIKAEYNKAYYKKQLEWMAWHDQLTNLLNRRKFIELIEAKRSTSIKNSYIAMIDIDHFKKINDTYGHIAGDHVLIELASIFNKEKENNMMIARYGGEEFIVYLEAATLEEAILSLEQLRQHVHNTSFEIDPAHHIHISISIGLAKWEKDYLLQEVIDTADQHLYIAKERGRNQLISSYHVDFVYS